jgi:Zn-dependent protease with chaperone function
MPVLTRTACPHVASVLDYFGDDRERVDVDLHDLLVRAWRSKTLREARREWALPGRRYPVPTLKVRHATKPYRSASPRPERQRDLHGGHAYGHSRIVVTVGPGTGREWAEAILLHEAAHCASAAHVHHGSAWRATYVRLVHEMFDVLVRNEGPNWRLDEVIAKAIRTEGL